MKKLNAMAAAILLVSVAGCAHEEKKSEVQNKPQAQTAEYKQKEQASTGQVKKPARSEDIAKAASPKGTELVSIPRSEYDALIRQQNLQLQQQLGGIAGGEEKGGAPGSSSCNCACQSKPVKEAGGVPATP